MSNPIRIGMAGTGFGRRVMLPAFAALEGVRLQAVCSATEKNAVDTAAQFDIPGVYTDYDAMLDDADLDLVVITTPPHLHLPMCQVAFEKGCHVLCEKPTALDLSQARQMLEAARRAGTVHVIDHELRFHPSLRQLKKLIDEGFLGPGHSVSFAVNWVFPSVLRQWGWWFDKATGGGLWGALGSHQIDLLRWLFRTEVKRVNGWLHSFAKELPVKGSQETKPVTTDNFCSVMVELDNGALGTLTMDATPPVSMAEATALRSISFHGQEGSLVFDSDDRLWAIRGEDKEEHTQPNPGQDTPGLPPGIFPSGFACFSRVLIETLQDGGTTVPGAADFGDGVKNQAVLDAVHHSHQGGGWVEPDNSP